MKRIILLVICLLAHIGCFAFDEFLIKSFEHENDFPTSACYCILRDSRGYVWLGTSDGLCRYNGFSIDDISSDKIQPDNNFCLSLCEDNSGRIWIGTSDGLCLYDSISGMEQRYETDTSFSAYQLLKDSDGNIWTNTGKNGLLSINPDTMKKKYHFAEYQPKAFCFNQDGTIYFVSRDGRLYSASKKDMCPHPLFDADDFKPFEGWRIHKMFYAFGCILAGVAEKSAIVDLARKQIRWNNWSVIQGVETISGTAAILACDKGVFKINSNGEEEYRIFDKTAIGLGRDGDDGFWIGTSSGAVHLIANKAELQTINGYHIRDIAPDTDGTIWVGTEDYGLMHVFPQSGRFDFPKLPFKSKNIHGLCVDGDYIWVGTYSQDDPIGRLNKKTGKWELFNYGSKTVFYICKSRYGGVLVGTTSGLQVIRDGKVSEIKRFPYSIDTIFEDSNGTVWLSTAHDGLYKIDGPVWDENVPFTRFQYDQNDHQSISSNKIFFVTEDSKSRIWVSTQSNGFCRFIPETQKFIRYESLANLDLSATYRISEDPSGLLWLSGSRGLFCFDPENGESIRMTRNDGMPSTKYNCNANVIDSSGRIWLGAGKSLISFKPSKLVSCKHNVQILMEPLEDMTLRYKDNDVKILASVVDNGIPQTIRLKYRINDKWYNVENGIITLLRLPVGQHTLTVSAYGADGRSILDSRSINIRIRRPLAVSHVALLLYILLITAVIYMVRKRIKMAGDRKIAKEKERIERENEINLYTAKLEFVTNVAHDIKTPLALIKAPIDSLRSKIGSSEDVDTIGRNCDRLTELVSQLLDFKNIEKAGYSVNISECEICSIVTDIYKRYSLSARLRKMNLSISLPDEPLYAFCDKEALDKIISNLLSNACKYGSSYAKLTISTGEDFFRIITENDGTIVPMDMRNNIFKAFVRYVDDEKPVSGNGIGLSTCHALALALGGTLEMDQDSRINRFILTLPYVFHPEENGSKNTVTDVIHPLSPNTDNITHTILVVEDNDDMRGFLTRQFAENFKVLSASNGKEALDILQCSTEDPDIIISDLMMPLMNGLELCERIKRKTDYSHIPVVLLTAKTDLESKIAGLDTGAEAFVEKPFALEYLKSVVNSILNNRERLKKHNKTSPSVSTRELNMGQIDKNLIERLEEYIDANIANEKLRVEDLASIACMSTSNLQRKMHSLLGMSVNEFLQLHRLKKAAKLLKEENAMVSEISDIVGFGSHAYFSTCFKKQFGMSPKDYMQRR